ncbi:hypothetical protein [Rhizobium laguerreae]|uniref:hypothetical protein n=1 Tax=Rhizobium laguerreae TaxID=1076926 RepID=UPI001DF2D36A|nr:hypothetical protein [Rhizobium laguerreae]MBY3201325.1 hypothetical protein [Rhizobium laguerreae]
MPINYLDEFPIDAALLPARLRALLEPVGLEPALRVDVSTRFEYDPYGPAREHVHMVMAVMAEAEMATMGQPDATGNGVVEFSTPHVEASGALREYVPSIDGHDYIVASWGSGSFYTYMLAEKVWMGLGLSMRALGQEAQKVVFDDMSLPEFGVAEGEISGSYNYVASRNLHWTLSNEYLRQYLWMRGAWGVRLFYYQSLFPDAPAIRDIMNGMNHVSIGGGDTWFELDVQEHDGGLLVQVWGKVFAVSPDRCPVQSADGMVWPGIDGIMTQHRAEGIVERDTVYLDDQFLEKYEQNGFYDTLPIKVHGRWLCSPSYHGQWSFTDCERVGRNLIRVSIRELYKPKPEREILHAFQYVLSPAQVANFDPGEEHIVAKINRLVGQLLNLGDLLSNLGEAVGTPADPEDIVRLSRKEITANGWLNSPELQRLAQVAPVSMTEQAFLGRCKSVHELYQRIPNGFLRGLVQRAGHSRKDIGEIASLKLLQALTNIVERLNADGEKVDAFASGSDPDDLTSRNNNMAALFINNDLRIADAHQAGGVLKALIAIGFDIAGLNNGYGRALDHVLDKVIAAFDHLNRELKALLAR